MAGIAAGPAADAFRIESVSQYMLDSLDSEESAGGINFANSS
jgi:hypothetical protein